jgi:LysM repeat protein
MKHKLTTVLALAVCLLSACAAPPAPALIPSATLTLRSGALPPFQTRTLTITPTRPNPATPTPLPTPTPTLRSHVVKAGEDMSGIALRYRIKLSELKTANPSVIPNAMKIGTILTIPGTEIVPTARAGATFTPTPAAILLENPICYPDPSGGLTCFALARNLQTSAVENLTVAIRLVDGQGKTLFRQQVTTMLNLLGPGSLQTVMAYFPPPLPADFQAVSQLVSVLPAAEGEKRYLAVKVENQQINIQADGLSAEVSGEAHSIASQAAGQVWVAAVAYNSAGGVVGLRRWQASGPLPAGGSLPFAFNVYSAAAAIASVELQVESRP